MRRTALALVTVLTAGPAAFGGTELVNPSFEDGLDGWAEMTGAQTGGGDARADIVVDESVARDGKRSLRVRGTPEAVVWPLRFQSLDVAPGRRVTVRVAARCEGVTRAGRQYPNSNATLMFRDASGNRLGFVTSAVLFGDREWVDLVAEGVAPAGTVTAEVGVFHSMSGTAWFDDVRVAIASTDIAEESARSAAFDALADHLRRTYPFWGLDGKPDAEELFARHRTSVVAAEDAATYAGALRAMLAELDDVHVWIDTPLGRIGTAAPGAGAQFDPRVVLSRLDEKLVHGRNVLAGWIGKGDERVGYLLVATFAKGNPEWSLVEEALGKLSAAPGLVVDVRPNGGGDETLGMALASRWADETATYAQQRWRDATVAGRTGFGPVQTRVLEPAPEAQRYSGRVAVLAGPGCVSSTEGFLLMCKALPRVTVVGQPSRGASGNPAGFDVLPGITVWASRWQSLDPEGRCIEGVGVQPDVVVAPGERGEDPVLDAAVRLLRE